MDSEQAEKKSVRVTIFHQHYTLRVPGDPQEVQELARTVDDLMDAISSRTGSSDTTRVAVLACLHMADRLRSLERDLNTLRERIGKTSEQFSLLLDQALEDREE